MLRSSISSGACVVALWTKVVFAAGPGADAMKKETISTLTKKKQNRMFTPLDDCLCNSDRLSSILPAPFHKVCACYILQGSPGVSCQQGISRVVSTNYIRSLSLVICLIFTHHSKNASVALVMEWLSVYLHGASGHLKLQGRINSLIL